MECMDKIPSGWFLESELGSRVPGESSVSSSFFLGHVPVLVH